MDVPEILRSGHHEEIARWRRRESLRRTFERRPELLKSAQLTPDDLTFLRGLGYTLPRDPRFPTYPNRNTMSFRA